MVPGDRAIDMGPDDGHNDDGDNDDGERPARADETGGPDSEEAISAPPTPTEATRVSDAAMFRRECNKLTLRSCSVLSGFSSANEEHRCTADKNDEANPTKHGGGVRAFGRSTA
jgi:hypothetical protein